jgi:hypothetical protein
MLEIVGAVALVGVVVVLLGIIFGFITIRKG